MRGLLSYMIRSSRKGNLSIKTAALVILGIMTVALVFMASSSWLQDIGSGFVGSVEYPTP